MAFHNNPKIATDGLVCCLDANDAQSYPGSGNDWFDLTGHNDWTITAGSSFSNGVLTLDDINAGNDSGASPPSAWQGSTDCTIDTWYNMTTPFGSCCDTIFGRYDFRFFQIGTSIYTMISFEANNTPGYTDGARYYQHPSYTISSGVWHHLVGMRRGGRFIIWIDGVEKYNADFGTSLYLYGATNENWYINTNRHNAKYGVCRIWNRGLSDDEILQNFNAQRSMYGK